jgi:hypothetical protein
MDVEPLMDAMVLQRSNQLETRAIAHVREPGIAMTTEVALQDSAVSRAIE